MTSEIEIARELMTSKQVAVEAGVKRYVGQNAVRVALEMGNADRGAEYHLRGVVKGLLAGKTDEAELQSAKAEILSMSDEQLADLLYRSYSNAGASGI